MSAIVVPFLLVPTQITFQALKQSMAPVIGFHADLLLHRIDVALHQGMAWTWFEPLLMNPSLIRALDLLYMSWFGLLFLFMPPASAVLISAPMLPGSCTSMATSTNASGRPHNSLADVG